jgi:hypothetical protein
MTPAEPEAKPRIARREMLTGAGVAAAIATVLRPGQAEARQSTPEEKAARYIDSAHVQRFYALNRR